jgi:hypothetical protein
MGGIRALATQNRYRPPVDAFICTFDAEACILAQHWGDDFLQFPRLERPKAPMGDRPLAIQDEREGERGGPVAEASHQVKDARIGD